jgi:CubicO group peptidase (beta-lactamase class C family)
MTATDSPAITFAERCSQWDPFLADELASWQVTDAGLAVIDTTGLVALAGPTDQPRRWASVTKIVAALAVLDSADRGELSLDEPAGPPGSTVRHLLAHASGWAFDEERVMASPGTRRIYSNVGIDAAAEFTRARVGAPDVATLLAQRVLTPLGMLRTEISGPAAHGAVGPVSDLALLARELLIPRILPSRVIESAITPSFPGLAGVLPGFGKQTPNDWGLGVEVRGHKTPHWTPESLSPSTFGHFGQSGSFLWVDRTRGLAVASAAGTDFGPWAAQDWPRTSARILAHHLELLGGTR